MGDLIPFSQRIKEQLKNADRQPHWTPEEADQYMAAVAERRERFEQLASRLIDEVIRPRLAALVGFFPNATFARNDSPGHCSCWLAYCERFPATTKVSLSVEHDVRYEKATVSYEASMMPVFIKLNENDKLTAPLNEMQDAEIADWVEQRLLEFLDAYLRIDRGGDQLDEEPVTDPVCGMRIGRSEAVASESYYGHPYFFCSKVCQERFNSDPKAYVEVKTF